MDAHLKGIPLMLLLTLFDGDRISSEGLGMVKMEQSIVCLEVDKVMRDDRHETRLLPLFQAPRADGR